MCILVFYTPLLRCACGKNTAAYIVMNEKDICVYVYVYV